MESCDAPLHNPKSAVCKLILNEKLLALSRVILRGILGDFGADWETKLKSVFREGRMDVNWINCA